MISIAGALILASCGGDEHSIPEAEPLRRSINFETGETSAIRSDEILRRVQWVRKPTDFFSETGLYFDGILEEVPTHYATETELCRNCWLVAEASSRNGAAMVGDFLQEIVDPDDPDNQVLRLSSPDHTDGVILRSRSPLPENYRISFRIGHIQYGSDDPLNGYDVGDERGEPWMKRSAVSDNGVYWLTIMDTRPAPHNNVWGHHHRKFFIDAWNSRGRRYGVTAAAVDGLTATHPQFGKKFIAHDGTRWRNGSTDPAFYYLPDQWYTVVFERMDNQFSFSVKGVFAKLGRAEVTGSLDAAINCVYHYNRSPEELHENCLSRETIRIGGEVAPAWPADRGYPDYFMMGDPHINYYEGSVLIDDLTLETL